MQLVSNLLSRIILFKSTISNFVIIFVFHPKFAFYVARKKNDATDMYYLLHHFNHGLFIKFFFWQVLRNVAALAVGVRCAAEPEWASSIGGSEKSFS